MLTESPKNVEEREEEEAYFDIQEAGGGERGNGLYYPFLPFQPTS